MSLFCKHKWKEKERHRFTGEYFYGGSTEFMIIVQECEKCGKLKKIKIP